MKNLFLNFVAITGLMAILILSPAVPARSAGFVPPASTPKAEATGLKIAVAPVDAKIYSYDNIGSILDSMGWAYTEINFKDLRKPELLAKFDVVFINCSRPLIDGDDPEVPYDGVTDPSTWAGEHSADSLKKFVSDGGTLYASDQAYIYIDKAFPGYLHFFEKADFGPDGLMKTRVVDPGLATTLGSSTISINFDLGAWVPVDSVSEGVKVYLTADEFPDYSGEVFHDRPIAASFAYGKGRVVFTSFHNQTQTSDLEKKLLNYLILISTTTNLSSTMEDTVTTAGYPIQQEILGSISSGASSPKYVLANPATANLAIGLNWQDGTLGLSVFQPDGSLYAQKDGPPPLLIEIPDAQAGDWSYQINGLTVPFDNYPYVVDIGGPPLVEATPTAVAAGPIQPDGNTGGNTLLVVAALIGCMLCLAVLAVVAGILAFFWMRQRAGKSPGAGS